MTEGLTSQPKEELRLAPGREPWERVRYVTWSYLVLERSLWCCVEEMRDMEIAVKRPVL